MKIPPCRCPLLSALAVHCTTLHCCCNPQPAWITSLPRNVIAAQPWLALWLLPHARQRCLFVAICDGVHLLLLPTPLAVASLQLRKRSMHCEMMLSRCVSLG